MFITDNRSDELSDEVKALFSTQKGGKPFTEIGQLREALIELYADRVHLGLEYPAVYDLPSFPNTYTCSVETQDVTSFLLDEIYEGLEFSLDLINMETYLESINEWIIEFNTPPPAPAYSRRGGFRSWEDF